MNAWEIGILAGVTSAVTTQFILGLAKTAARLFWLRRTRAGRLESRMTDQVSEILERAFPEKTE